MAPPTAMAREIRARTANPVRSPELKPPVTVHIEDSRQTRPATATTKPRTPVASILIVAFSGTFDLLDGAAKIVQQDWEDR